MIFEAWNLQRIKLLRYRSQQLDPRAQEIYSQMVERMSRAVMLLLMALTIPLGIFFSVQSFQSAWIVHTMPRASFVVHTTTFVLAVLVATFFLRRSMVSAAWVSMLCLNLTAVLLQIWLLRNSGLLLFALLSMTAPAIIAPVRINALLVGGMLVALFLIVRFAFPTSSDTWISIAILFTAIVLSFVCIGGVIRRFIAQFAQTTAQIEREAVLRGRLEQEMHDLQRLLHDVISLEHDIRQPLRAAQGYLMTLEAELAPWSGEALILPAQAAIGRVERLVNNLLGQARAEARQQHILYRPADLAQLFAHIQHVALGIARYYTDPPVPVHFTTHLLSNVLVDSEEVERAILNLLDNALAHAPPGSVVEVCARTTATAMLISVRDQGPGIPTNVVESLADMGLPSRGYRQYRGLGLPQVCRMAQAHCGSVSITSTENGATVEISIPLHRGHSSPI